MPYLILAYILRFWTELFIDLRFFVMLLELNSSINNFNFGAKVDSFCVGKIKVHYTLLHHYDT